MTTKPSDYYRYRKLTEGVPGMEENYVRIKRKRHEDLAESNRAVSGIGDILKCIDRLIDLTCTPRTVAVVGCGPNPVTLVELLKLNFDAIGVEPVEESLQAAQKFLGDESRIMHGTAEALPFPQNSQCIVIMESVLEHVDSPVKSLSEAYRVVEPGGVLFIRTTNRWHFSPLGRNFEFQVPFYNWFPKIVKESYVFKHLHYKPSLAKYSPRPAVHWYTYAELCSLGRQAGFAQFYSPMDIANLVIGSAHASFWKQYIDRLRRNPWLRALNLTQIGGDIYMWKRK